ncbi:hypothetical protein EX30DRAFT_389540 [Ascodesmis nigricans]|uniref:Uncharacterized protein n=1 Tax=Ascodesmis nigricans TaxID=341454 RepID=A0A4S2MIN6_9PEZI|nr:hypothetical protein EX30DRAFT_389540 [Ascodesmis nigricans]
MPPAPPRTTEFTTPAVAAQIRELLTELRSNGPTYPFPTTPSPSLLLHITYRHFQPLTYTLHRRVLAPFNAYYSLPDVTVVSPGTHSVRAVRDLIALLYEWRLPGVGFDAGVDMSYRRRGGREGEDEGDGNGNGGGNGETGKGNWDGVKERGEVFKRYAEMAYLAGCMGLGRVVEVAMGVMVVVMTRMMAEGMAVVRMGMGSPGAAVAVSSTPGVSTPTPTPSTTSPSASAFYSHSLITLLELVFLSPPSLPIPLRVQTALTRYLHTHTPSTTLHPLLRAYPRFACILGRLNLVSPMELYERGILHVLDDAATVDAAEEERRRREEWERRERRGWEWRERIGGERRRGKKEMEGRGRRGRGGEKVTQYEARRGTAAYNTDGRTRVLTLLTFMTLLNHRKVQHRIPVTKITIVATGKFCRPALIFTCSGNERRRSNTDLGATKSNVVIRNNEILGDSEANDKVGTDTIMRDNNDLIERRIPRSMKLRGSALKLKGKKSRLVRELADLNPAGRLGRAFWTP